MRVEEVKVQPNPPAALLAYFVAHDLRLVLQGFHSFPVQDDLGVRRVPHDFKWRLAGS